MDSYYLFERFAAGDGRARLSKSTAPVESLRAASGPGQGVSKRLETRFRNRVHAASKRRLPPDLEREPPLGRSAPSAARFNLAASKVWTILAGTPVS